MAWILHEPARDRDREKDRPPRSVRSGRGFANLGFVGGKSVFDPERTVWAASNFDALKELFVDRPDVGAQNYLAKLELEMQ